MAEPVVLFSMLPRVGRITLMAASLGLAAPVQAQTAAGKRAPDIPLSPLTVEGGGGTSEAAKAAYLAAADMVGRKQPDSAQRSFAEAARLARAAFDSVTVADAQYRIGLLLWSRGEYEKAIPPLDSARALRVRVGDDAELARVLNTLGASHYQLGIYERAIDAFETALRLRRRSSDSAGLVRTLTNIGKTYHDWEQLEYADRILTEAVTVAGTAPERASALGYALNSRAFVNIDRGHFDEARNDIARSREAYRRFFTLSGNTDTTDAWELNTSAEGLLALRQQHPGAAITLLEPVLASATARKSVRGQTRALLHLGDAYQKLQQPSQARAMYEKALAVSSAANQRTLMLASLNRLSAIEEAAGNTAAALKLLREFNALWNVIYDQDATLRITSREARQATDQALSENQRQQLVIERAQVTVRLGVVILVLVVTLLVFFVRFTARERTRARALTKANEDLVALNEELRTALATVKTLSGLVPICANCKRIRDDQGYWNQVEAYLEQHSDATFSHSICQSCGPELYGDLWPQQST